MGCNYDLKNYWLLGTLQRAHNWYQFTARAYVEVKTHLGVERSVSLTLNEYNFLVEEKSSQKWLYIILLDRGDLVGEKFEDCFSFFRVPCTQLKASYFEVLNSSHRILRYKRWRPLSNRCRVTLPDGLEIVLHYIREEYAKLFQDRASRVLWRYKNDKIVSSNGHNSQLVK